MRNLVNMKAGNSIYPAFPMLLSALLIALNGCTGLATVEKINRKELVQRHRVNVKAADTLSSLTVGNGSFAFTADFTGLQSFPDDYENGVPLGTQSEWGWHSFPNDGGYRIGETMEDFEFYGRDVSYSVQIRQPERNREAVNYFRQNPHRLHLGVVGLEMFHEDGTPVAVSDIQDIDQELDPWTGNIRSRFSVDGTQVEVLTSCHPDLDMVSSHVTSPLIGEGRLKIALRFAYPDGQHSSMGCDWDREGMHSTTLEPGGNRALIRRQLDTTNYQVHLAWDGEAQIMEHDTHHLRLEPAGGSDGLSFSCLFTEEEPEVALPDYVETESASARAWEAFWMSGGAVDFSGSTDPRAAELERRVVLSQYLTRAQCAGTMPPQETGLTYNSWYGKFHLEMHWWHGVHFPLWGREHLLERSLDYYPAIAEKARQTAQRQGFDGLRWQKMTDPWGNDSPSSVGSFLIWQQPHLIMMSELCYRNHPETAFIEKHAPLVFETAEFMASYAHHDSASDRYVLGPLLIPAQESLPYEETINPPFELLYWAFGLETAQLWRERLGMERKASWDRVLGGLPDPATRDGLYLAAESAPDSYENPRYMSDHPMVLGAYGMIPSGDRVDPETMAATFDHVWKHWQWQEAWGWDFPMTAMAATRLGLPEEAVDALFMEVETNRYLPNGHNYQDERLRLYLPGNGGLLTAVAMMCAGWEGGPDTHAPGFPSDGSWVVKYEGLKKAL